jgi:hypothetical protein
MIGGVQSPKTEGDSGSDAAPPGMLTGTKALVVRFQQNGTSLPA